MPKRYFDFYFFLRGIKRRNMRELWKCSFLIHLQQEGRPKKFNLCPKIDIKEVSAGSHGMVEVGRDLHISAGPAPSQAESFRESWSGNFMNVQKKKIKKWEKDFLPFTFKCFLANQVKIFSSNNMTTWINWLGWHLLSSLISHSALWSPGTY